MTPPQEEYRTIPLTKNQIALVDSVQHERFSEHPYYASWAKGSHSFYAARKTSKKLGKQKTILMHREVLGLSKGDKRIVDHINGNTLDNRRCNLRIATAAQNAWHQKKSGRNKSGRRGISKGQTDGGFLVRIMYEGKRKYLGEYRSFEEACAVRDAAEKQYHGEFAGGA